MMTFNTERPMTQKEAAEKVAAARGWTIEANGNIGEYSEKFGYSFFAINRKGQRFAVSFNKRYDWKPGCKFPYDSMDEAEFAFKARCGLGVPHVVCETNSDATECVIAIDKEFGEAHPRNNTRTGKTIMVRSFYGVKNRVCKVANAE